jgi:hypothetical protein
MGFIKETVRGRKNKNQELRNERKKIVIKSIRSIKSKRESRNENLEIRIQKREIRNSSLPPQLVNP